MANAVNASLTQAQGGTPLSTGAGGSAAPGSTYQVPGGGTISQDSNGNYSYSQ
jgi:hypothetical protein